MQMKFLETTDVVDVDQTVAEAGDTIIGLRFDARKFAPARVKKKDLSPVGDRDLRKLLEDLSTLKFEAAPDDEPVVRNDVQKPGQSPVIGLGRVAAFLAYLSIHS